MRKIVIVDYGMCNLDSVARSVETCGGDPLVTDQAGAIEEAQTIILPGVGSFSDAMKELTSRSLVSVLRKQVQEKRVPFLGICLGMHLMATVGQEGGENEGLNFIPGQVVRFEPSSPSIRVPHIGWNEVKKVKESILFDGITDNTDFYFVHSYHICCEDKFVIARTSYCGEFVSAVGYLNCFGVQFHPEKSLRAGLKVIQNFLSLC